MQPERACDTGHDILPLRIHEEFSVKFIDAHSRVSRKSNSGSGLIGRVAKDHTLNIDSRAPIARNVVFLPVSDGALVVPGSKHSANGAPKLLPHIRGENFTRAALHQRLEAAHQLATVCGRHLSITHIFAIALLFELVNDHFKGFQVLTLILLHTHHHVAVHLHKTAVAIPGEPVVAGGFCHCFNRFIIEA